MRLVDLPRLLLRRWYIVLPGLICTAVLCALVMAKIPPRQELTSSVLLLPPAASVVAGGNPYLGLGGLEGAADVVAHSMSGVDLKQQVEATGADTYTVERDLTTAAPIVLITVDSNNLQSARNALALLTAQVPITLQEIQNAVNVPAPTMISSEAIAPESEPLVIRSPQIRAVLVAAAAGIAATLVFTTLLDLLLNRRSDRRKSSRSQATSSTATIRLGEGRSMNGGGQLGGQDGRNRRGRGPARRPRLGLSPAEGPAADDPPSEGEERWKA